ncbi:hypothetical protein [Sinorhizobium meliloti]|uniref:hypothetical protein n=1 Tax=Rhizobium meliloti TaxID=382 RepID=UPI001F3D5888|nr:hypothetical protein [Sinorhizobium meliloti]
MLRALVFMLFATAAVSASAAGRTGDSRFLVKAWVQKFDNSFEHVTGWCDGMISAPWNSPVTSCG